MPMRSICTIEGCHKPVDARGYCDTHYGRWKRHGDPLVVKYQTPARDFYERYVIPFEGDECLIWPFNCGSNGYGYLKVGRKNCPVSRLVCEAANGPPPSPKYDAAHSCGRGHEGCVSRRHLSWKTRADNCADKLIHGTDNRGERHRYAKLTESDVREIISLKGKKTQSEIGKQFGISFQQVSKIHSGGNWGWLAEHSSK